MVRVAVLVWLVQQKMPMFLAFLQYVTSPFDFHHLLLPPFQSPKDGILAGKQSNKKTTFHVFDYLCIQEVDTFLLSKEPRPRISVLLMLSLHGRTPATGML